MFRHCNTFILPSTFAFSHCAPIFSTDTGVIGRLDLTTSEGQEISVASHLQHPAYNGFTTENDVILIFLSAPASSDVELVKLNSDDSSPQVGETVAAAGWGLTNETNFFGSDVLMAVDVNTMSSQIAQPAQVRLMESLIAMQARSLTVCSAPQTTARIVAKEILLESRW